MVETVLTGRTWKFGDRISTDLMVPGHLLFARKSPEEAATYCMSANRPTWHKEVQQGDILIAGINFGCGSSRNGSAPLKTLGISCVLAESVARIHLRNAVNTGLPTLVCPGISEFALEGDRLEVNIVTGEVKNLTKGGTIQAEAWPQDSPPFQIMMAGGFDTFIRQKLVEAGMIPA
jgi:3-isopropylmalate/(R)-2-methylmalate dehydratase small subunit